MCDVSWAMREARASCSLSVGVGSSGNQATDLIGQILPVYQEFHDQVYGMGGAIHTHDPSAIAYLLDPDLFQAERMPVYVETEGKCAGQTVPDRRQQWIEAPVVNVCLNV